ncbi:sensor histidine kinase [Streptosporangium sp. NBC_01756]|uniref:sensor histidine kinase n=1 Tax=Streptosporangium sp. NBC_01756 TaxID=2975950 RepID=UPI002DDC8BB5|nr:ATP-binding protein [Streptosporangium sp. NBC_01756]WSC84813.1 hypothetical protein OIE48_31200 [Streptosporangium sp. NBC_01756]
MRERRSRSLAQDLEEYLSRWTERTGIAVEVWALPADGTSTRVAQAVLATLSEALANVERHSNADVVSIAVTLGDRGLRMTVSDDGVGFSGPAAGRGVTAMRAHFADLGGTLTVNGVEGGGTTVTATAPRRARGV